MSLRRAPCLVLLITGLWLSGPAAQAQLLLALQSRALAADPQVAGAEAQLRAAEERLVQAKAALGPSAALTLNQSDTRYTEAPAFDLRRFGSKQATLQLNQPLLRGAQTFGVRSAQASVEQAQAQRDQARAESTVRLLEAAFEVLKARDALSLVGAQQLSAQEQLAAAKRSFTVGNASVIDVREAEARIDTVAATAIAARADLELRQQVLAELAGRDAGDPAPELAPEVSAAWMGRGLTGERLPELPATGVLPWIADAQLRSPQLMAAQRALAAAQAEVDKAWQGHAPTADLSYTYTRNADTGTVTSLFPRRGDSGAVALSVNIPLFASGATQAKVREMVALRDKAQSELDTARRNLQIQVRQSFSATLASAGQARGLETAARSLEAAMMANRRGYEVGMKVNAEVLESQAKLFESRRDLSRARYDAWLNFMKLKAAAGSLGEADVAELDALLVPVPAAAMRGRNPERPPSRQAPAEERR